MSEADFPLIPPWEDMDFAANCTAWGNWLATWYLPNPWDRREYLEGGYIQAMTMIDASIQPDGFLERVQQANDSMSTPMIVAKVNEWWTYHLFDAYEYDDDGLPVALNFESAMVQNVLLPGHQSCPKEACMAQAYTGNADITGIGIYIAYYMQISLTTIYLLVFSAAATVDFFKKRSAKGAHSPLYGGGGGFPAPKPTLVRRALDAFGGTLDGFLMSAMLLCMAMISAALYLAVEGYKKSRLPESNRGITFSDSGTYNMVLSVIAAAFSTFPVLVLYTLLSRRDRASPDSAAAGGEPTNRRAWLRRAGLFAIWVLLAAEVFLSPRGNEDYEDRHTDTQKDENWDQCNKRGGERYWQTMKAAQFLVIGLPLLWLACSLVLTAGAGIPGLADRPWARRFGGTPWILRLRSVWEMGVAWLNLLIAWALLAYFSILRKDIIDTAGATDQASSWGFGQVLTLATWFPVILEWLYIFIWGIEDSLNTRLPRGFEVVSSDPNGEPERGQKPVREDDTLPFMKNSRTVETVRMDTLSSKNGTT